MEELRPEEGNLFEKIKAYVQVRVRLAVLSSIEKTAEIYASLISNFILLAFSFMVLLFSSIALAFYLSAICQSYWCGFLCVAGIYLLFAVILLLIRKKSIEKPLMDQFVQKVLANKNDEDDEKQGN